MRSCKVSRGNLKPKRSREVRNLDRHYDNLFSPKLRSAGHLAMFRKSSALSCVNWYLMFLLVTSTLLFVQIQKSIKDDLTSLRRFSNDLLRKKVSAALLQSDWTEDFFGKLEYVRRKFVGWKSSMEGHQKDNQPHRLTLEIRKI